MHIFSKEKAGKPKTSHDEEIYELLGRDFDQKTENHSVAHVVIPSRKESRLHRHPKPEESYYILKGHARITIGEEKAEITTGQIVLIPPTKPHKIENIGDVDLEFLAICVPAWEPNNTEFLK